MFDGVLCAGPVHHPFMDHHVYTEREVSDLERAASDAGADALLCTEKDVWNLRHVPLTELPVYCCRISLQLPENFRALSGKPLSEKIWERRDENSGARAELGG